VVCFSPRLTCCTKPGWNLICVRSLDSVTVALALSGHQTEDSVCGAALQTSSWVKLEAREVKIVSQEHKSAKDPWVTPRPKLVFLPHAGNASVLAIL
jgi:hypothetical protein